MASGLLPHLPQAIGDGVPGRINLIWATVVGKGPERWDEANQDESLVRSQTMNGVDDRRRIVSLSQICSSMEMLELDLFYGDEIRLACCARLCGINANNLVTPGPLFRLSVGKGDIEPLSGEQKHIPDAAD